LRDETNVASGADSAYTLAGASLLRADNDEFMKPALSLEKRGLKIAVSAPDIAGVAFRYGLAPGAVTVAAGVAVLTWNFGIPHGQASIFLFAIAVAAWYGGLGPTIVAVVFSAFAYSYFFTAPLYNFGATFYVALPKPGKVKQ
jgi:hypothetical protein